jgi:hypothetical protein
MKKKFIIFLLCSITVICSAEISFNNEISAHFSLFDASSSQRFHTKLNYKPKLDIPIYYKNSILIDAELVGNLYYNNYINDRKTITSQKIEAYRCWLRLSTDQSEIRIGRQKLNFGPALLLRSLRWFDTIDPRDPQQNTTGADAVLFRHYFLNNSSLWVWSLYSNSDLKGNEIIASKENSIEYGFRVEYPFEYCESGLTFHRRQLDFDTDEVNETRIGIDARWDAFMGYWLELTIGIFDEFEFLPEFEKNITLGTDYTIPFKNGIYLLAEHTVHSISESDFFTDSDKRNISAIDIEYPVSFFSSIKTIVFYNWNSHDISSLLTYSISLNYLDLYFSLNLNPEIDAPNYNNIYYDKASIQMRAIYNFDIF